MTMALAPSLTIRRAPRSEPPVQTEPRPRHLRLVPDPPQLPFEGSDPVEKAPRGFSFAPQRTGARALPPIAEFAEGYARAVSEALTGHRGMDLLAPHTTFALMQWMRGLVPTRSSRRHAVVAAPHVLRVLLCEVHDGVYEATAVVRRGPAVRAMSLRFVGLDHRWQCTYLEVIAPEAAR